LKKLNNKFFISLNDTGPVLNFSTGNSYEISFLGLLCFYKYLEQYSEDSKIKLNNIFDFNNPKFDEIKSIFKKECQDTVNFIKDYVNLPGMNTFLSHYHGTCCQQRFLDYSKDGQKEDIKAMNKYINNETSLPSVLTSLDESNTLSSDNTDSVNSKFTSIYKPILQKNEKKVLETSDLLKILKYTVGVRNTVVDLIQRKRISKFVPSGGNNHPTNVYVIKKISKDVAECYYYDHLKHSLIKIGGNLHFDSVVSSAHIMRNRIKFEPQICLLYSQTPQRTIFRYKDQRTYRVIHMDLGHVLNGIKDVSTALGYSCSHSYEPDNSSLDFLKSSNCNISEPLMAATILGA
jgi:SagB-type dehydrogenase family enzyme